MTTKDNSLHLQLRLQRSDFGLDVDLDLPARGISVLFGPSGSGKTTVLRCVAGLEQHAEGRIVIDGETWMDSAQGLFRPTWQRPVGYVFQEAGMFGHLDVSGNLQFGLRRSGVGHAAQTLNDAVSLLGIEHLLQRPVSSLSGGERQRVAIAQALATRPRILLMDEPLASLDPARKREVLPWLERLHDELQIPVLYVTHSVDEMARLADHVVLLQKGGVASSGPLSLAMQSSALTHEIGDEAGIVETGQVVERDMQHSMAQIEFSAGRVWGRDLGLDMGHAVRVRILARDVSLSLSAHEDSTIQNRFAGVIESLEPDVHPSQMLARVKCGTGCVLSRITRRSMDELKLQVGTSVWCQVKSVALIV